MAKKAYVRLDAGSGDDPSIRISAVETHGHEQCNGALECRSATPDKHNASEHRKAEPASIRMSSSSTLVSTTELVVPALPSAFVSDMVCLQRGDRNQCMSFDKIEKKNISGCNCTRTVS